VSLRPCAPCAAPRARLDKQRENAAALAVLPDLLTQLDGEPLRERLLSLVEGVLAVRCGRRAAA
jgi:hypothetical protein